MKEAGEFFHIVQSIELAKQFQLKEALRLMKIAYRKDEPLLIKRLLLT